MAANKTNIMRLLEKEKILYTTYTYDIGDQLIDGISVAMKIGEDVHFVYKTLIAKGHSGQYYCFVLPVMKELNLKKAAKWTKEKNIQMIKVSEINAITGYVRGGCSPIGLKKPMLITIDESIRDLNYIVISGGKIGIQIKLDPEDLIKMTKGQIAQLTDD